MRNVSFHSRALCAVSWDFHANEWKRYACAFRGKTLDDMIACRVGQIFSSDQTWRLFSTVACLRLTSGQYLSFFAGILLNVFVSAHPSEPPNGGVHTISKNKSRTLQRHWNGWKWVYRVAKCEKRKILLKVSCFRATIHIQHAWNIKRDSTHTQHIVGLQHILSKDYSPWLVDKCSHSTVILAMFPNF